MAASARFGSVTITEGTNPAIAEIAIAAEKESSKRGLLLAGILALIGGVLVVIAIPGTTAINVSVGSLSASATNATAGVCFLLLAVAIVALTHFRVKIKGKR